ncbi:hypothetical protein TSUD_413480 [Trifolium subterraneum]|uniref:Reverse transcriptase zinc-binding domain-containing protein n=1 Tax=Trifolium subterraneum TaxID=3900 RepID=A0A2Z6P4U2_TRISU|nr:hypothetical protein TSUD_413480 [Trifolium subterraneum]
MEKPLPFFWWTTDSSKVYTNLFACFCSLLLQSSLSWKTICLRKEYGGLRVRQLREFNLALLGKWCWRCLVDRGGMWFRVLAARYVVERGRLREGGRNGSSWWREIVRIRDGIGVTLRERFGRLFDLTEHKSGTVADMCSLGWEVGGGAWVWQRQLWVWEEEMLGECQGAYQLLTSQQQITLGATDEHIWHKQVPLKVSILAWRLLRDRTTPSKFELGEVFPEDLFTEIEDLNQANWEVRIPGARQRICSKFKNGGFPMYQIAFEHMGIRLPFNDLELAPIVPLFFHLFRIQRSRPRGYVTNKCGWVSLMQHKRFFEMFEESLRGFKDMWYVVRPITSVGWKTIIIRGPKLDDDGKVVLGDDGQQIEVDCERFPFCWSQQHYSREAKSFTYKRGSLSKEELADAKALENFVDGFPANLWEDKEGNHLYDEDGEMKNAQVTLRKLQAEKKKRQAGGAASSALNSSAQSSPSRSVEVTEDKRAPEGIPLEQRPPKNARVEGGGCTTLGPQKLVPGRAAAEFVLPPAMGHENVVAESSVAVFKLLEIATFLNGRECKYLRERDEARAHAKDFGERLTVVENDLSSQTKACADAEGKVTKLENELKDAKEEEEKLKGRVAELAEQVSRLSLSPAVEEEEKKLDPEGTYAKFSRTDLIAKIYQIGDLQLEVASSSFQNALAQLQVLNPYV